MALSVTRPALAGAFGHSDFLLAAPALVAAVRAATADRLPVLQLDRDGVIATPGGDGEAQRLPLNGAPAGLLVALADPETASAQQQLEAFFQLTGLDPLPHFLALDNVPQGAVGASYIAAALAPLMATDLQRLRRQLGEREAALVHMRQQSTALHLSLEKARFILEAAGIDDNILSFSLAAGDTAAGPGGDLSAHRLVQCLGHDGFGLSALALSVARAAPKARGTLHIRLRRPASGHQIAEWRYPAADLTVGALHLSLAAPVADMTGDLELEIIWPEAEGEAPLLALAARRVDRFGLAGSPGRSLALQLWRGMAAPTGLTPPAFRPAFRTEMVALTAVADGDTAAFDAAEAALGFPLLQTSTSGGWLQTHPAKNGATLWYRLPAALPAGTRRARLLVRTDHKNGPVIRYDAAAEAQGPQGERVRSTAAKSLAPARNGLLTLDLPAGLEGPADLLIAATSEEERVSYAWCRWYSLDTEVPTRAAAAPPEPPRRTVSIERFPAFQGRMVYLGGPAAQQAVFEREGFSPLLISEDEGYLQTHPLAGVASGALMEEGLPAGTLSALAEVFTAHDAASPTLFAMLALPPETVAGAGLQEQATRWMRDIEHRQKGDARPITGTLADGEGVFAAAALAGQGTAQLRLGFETALSEPRALLWCCWPLGDTISFGWCRWRHMIITSEQNR